ncbi:MAG: GAF domain-containing sensor histidine kinase [Thermomicrobiales bacterium]
MIFQPIHARVQRLVNRFVFGDRDDPYLVIARLTHHLADPHNIGNLLSTLIATTAESLRLPYAALYLDHAGNLELAAEVGTPGDTTQRFPLLWQGQSIGALDVAPRGRGEPFSAADRRLLADLASQIGLAAHAVTLAQDLQASRQRIVTSREEERRRIRRDLHDGLGAHLAALRMQASAIHALVRRDPDRAESELVLMHAELRTAIDEIRGLVQGLRPPALDDLGLAGALRARLDRIGHGTETQPLILTVEITDSLPALSAATEVAAYRIVEEAVTNVLRHAQATTLRVTVQPDGDTLKLEIVDNGIGLPSDRPAGVGTHSMHERTAELGGSLSIISMPDHAGTIVRANFPLDRRS